MSMASMISALSVAVLARGIGELLHGLDGVGC
jgi:hypothetical protein